MSESTSQPGKPTERPSERPEIRTPAEEIGPQNPADAAKNVCDLCGSEMFEWHCRIICAACGYQRDCSDP